MCAEHLPKQLQCSECKRHGTLVCSEVNEKRRGLGGKLRWRCRFCKQIGFEMPLCREVKRDGQRSGPGMAESNLRLALAAA